MKIACIGNMNNALFCLTRYLRDMGYNAHLLTLEGEPEHFSPEADTYSDQFRSYTKELAWSKKPSVLYRTTKKEILNAVRQYDFFIACDIAIAYLAKAGIRTDIFIPYGRDIHTIPYIKIFQHHWRKWHKMWHLRHFQRKAISDAGVVSLEESNPDFEKHFVRPLKIENKRIKTTAPFIFYPQYEGQEIAAYAAVSPIYAQFLKIREHHDILVFHHCRQEWRPDGGLEVQRHVWTKGNDILIKGFAEFVRNNQSVKSALIMFEYGTQVGASKELVRSLGITKHVFWFPKSFRKDIMLGIHLADMGVGELGLSWYTYGVIVEYMTMGIPVVHRRDDLLYVDEKKSLYPMIHASNVFEIEQAIEKVLHNRRESKKIGVAGKNWFKENLVHKPMERYINIIQKGE